MIDPSEEESLLDGMLRLSTENEEEIVEDGYQHVVGIDETVNISPDEPQSHFETQSPNSNSNNYLEPKGCAEDIAQDSNHDTFLNREDQESDPNEPEHSAGAKERTHNPAQNIVQEPTLQKTPAYTTHDVDLLHTRQESAANKIKRRLHYEDIVRKARHLDERIKKGQNSYAAAMRRCAVLERQLPPGNTIQLCQLELARDYLVATEVTHGHIAKKIEMKKVHLKLLEEGREMELEHGELGTECRRVYNMEIWRARNVFMR